MKSNFNKIINYKYALKAIPRGLNKRRLIVDLNDKRGLSFALPKKAAIYPQVFQKRTSVSEEDPSLTWDLIERVSFVNKKYNVSYFQEPLIKYSLAGSYMYSLKKLVGREVFLNFYRLRWSGFIYKPFLSIRFSNFCKNCLSTANISNKIYYFNLHKNNKFLFQKPKIVSDSFYIHSQQNALIKFRKSVLTTQKILNINLLLSSNFDLSKSFIQNNLGKIGFYSNKQDIIQNKLKKVLVYTFLKKLSNTKLLKNYLQLNETNKKRIKESIQATNSAFIKSEFFRVKKEFYCRDRKFCFSKKPRKKSNFFKRRFKNVSIFGRTNEGSNNTCEELFNKYTQYCNAKENTKSVLDSASALSVKNTKPKK